MKNISQINRLSLRDQVYQKLKSAIIYLELEPGEKISDKLLAEQFGVSRTPVREALKRLEDEGLVESSPGSETKVSLVDSEQAKHAFTIVAALHALAAKLAIPYLTEEHIHEMIQINQQLKDSILQSDMTTAIQKDTEFHDVIINASQNPEISVALNRLLPKIIRLELLKFSSIDGMSSVQQHQRIIDCLSSEDKNLLPNLLENNWLSLANFLIEENK